MITQLTALAAELWKRWWEESGSKLGHDNLRGCQVSRVVAPEDLRRNPADTHEITYYLDGWATRAARVRTFY